MYSAIDSLWVAVAVAMMLLMQAGFTMLETGFTRAKNAGNIAMKNLSDFVVGSLVFWFIGFGFIHNSSVGGFIGKIDLFTRGQYLTGTVPLTLYLVFQMLFCCTAATIVSGAMAGRTRFGAYIAYSVLISSFVYPISAHWIWNEGGWLNQLGFHDFAGSTAVHLVGGTAAFVGAKMVGARIGKYSIDGKSKAIPGQSMSFGVLGIFLLWFGWYGFDAGSTLSITGDANILTVSRIIFNVTVCAATSACTAMMISWKRYSKPDISMTFNGALAGLVAITSGCDTLSPLGACITGIVVGFIVIFSIEFVDNKLKIDDPVGAISAHGIAGAVGTILTGVFSTDSGFLYTGYFSFFFVQILGVVAVIVWTAAAMIIGFSIINKLIGIRVDEDGELKGLDISEHGATQGTAIGHVILDGSAPSPVSLFRAMDVEDIDKEQMPDEYKQADGKMRKVVVVMNPNRLEVLMKALDKIEITGMTVTNVSGCGIQKGNTEYYRGSELESHLIPKVKVEIVIVTVPVALLIETIKKTIRTGKIGDGKIFVYDVERVVKVRTGAEGREALE
ncbi:MAG: ammonium transporter [Butyrivibrio sp.]|nr:ammonium transporter [Butyrivibrio sp.]